MHPGAAVACAYLSGSVPFAWIVARTFAGVDIRKVGSGNVGATNVGRVLGKKGFAAVFALDAAKGALPVLLLPPAVGLDAAGAERIAIACALAAVLGHMFPVFLRFRGGKGVATGAGVMGALLPLPALCAFGAFGAALGLFRYVSLASVVAAASLVPLSWAFGHGPETVVFAAVVAALVLVRHRANLGRIAAGTEPRAFARKEAPRA